MFTIQTTKLSTKLHNAVVSKAKSDKTTEFGVMRNGKEVKWRKDTIPMAFSIKETYMRVQPLCLKARKDADFEIIRSVDCTHRKFYKVNGQGKLDATNRSPRVRNEGYSIDLRDVNLDGTFSGLTHDSVMNWIGTFFEQIVGKDKSGIKDNSTRGGRLNVNPELQRWLSSGIQGFKLEIGLFQLKNGNTLVLKGEIEPTKATNKDTYQFFVNQSKWSLDVVEK